MAWTWRFLGEDGEALDAQPSPDFPAQADAESWLGEEWPELAEVGVSAVTLLEGDREVYGPMSLKPADPT